MANDGLLCWSCGKPTGIVDKVLRNDACVECMADLRCCRGCRHFDPTRRFHCRENIEHPQKNKEKSNFCEFFQKRDVMKVAGGVSSHKPKEDAKKSFDDLFKD